MAPAREHGNKGSVLSRTSARITIATLVMVGFLAGSAGGAFATTDPSDPLNGSGDSFFSQLQSYLTSHLVPLVVGLAVVGVAVGMLVKWGKKAAKSA